MSYAYSEPLSRKERMMRIWSAQGEHCSVCGEPLDPAFWHYRGDLKWTFEHVYPRRRYRCLLGNVLIAHQICNTGKDQRDPTGCEIILLMAANAKLGRTLAYRDDAMAPIRLAIEQPRPTAIELAWRRHVEARARDARS